MDKEEVIRRFHEIDHRGPYAQHDEAELFADVLRYLAAAPETPEAQREIISAALNGNKSVARPIVLR